MAYAINLLLVIFACGKNVNAKHQKSLFLKQRSFGFGRPSKTNKLDIRSTKEPIKLQTVAKALPSPNKSIIRNSAAKSLPSRVISLKDGEVFLISGHISQYATFKFDSGFSETSVYPLGVTLFCEEFSDDHDYFANGVPAVASSCELRIQYGYVITLCQYHTDSTCSSQSGSFIWCDNDDYNAIRTYDGLEIPSWNPDWAKWIGCPDPDSSPSHSFGQIADPNDPNQFIHASFASTDCTGVPLCTGWDSDSSLIPPASHPSLSKEDTSYTTSDEMPSIDVKSVVISFYGSLDCGADHIYEYHSAPVSKCYTSWGLVILEEPKDIIIHDDCSGFTKFQSSDGSCTGSGKLIDHFPVGGPLDGVWNECDRTGNRPVIRQCLNPSNSIDNDYIAGAVLAGIVLAVFAGELLNRLYFSKLFFRLFVMRFYSIFRCFYHWSSCFHLLQVFHGSGSTLQK